MFDAGDPSTLIDAMAAASRAESAAIAARLEAVAGLYRVRSRDYEEAQFWRTDVFETVAAEATELVALAEVRAQLGEKVQRRYGFRKLYRSHQDLARDPEVEAVGVSASFSEQAAIAGDLLRAGKHVFMEKPMAVSSA